jgi:hypothetical protein
MEPLAGGFRTPSQRFLGVAVSIDGNSQLDGLKEVVDSAVRGTQGSWFNGAMILAWAVFLLLGVLLIVLTQGEFLEPLIEVGIGWVDRGARGKRR